MFKSLFSCTNQSHTKADSELFIQESQPLKPNDDPQAQNAQILNPETPDPESSFTFKVDRVELQNSPPSLFSAEHIIRERLSDFERPGHPSKFTGRFEDFSHRKDMKKMYVNEKMPGMVAAIHRAFQYHYALSLSVSDFIILIGQGLGAHINQNAEKLRKNFVEHEGKQTIKVIRDEFVLGEQNDWSTVFGEFAEQIQKKTKADVYDVIIDDTSVATMTSRIVSEITLMEALKSYFSYEVETNCGIPQITLEGKREDWQKLKDKVTKLVEMNKDDCLDLKWWLDELVPVVDKICEAGIERKVDRKFWSDIYKFDNMSGTDVVTGWIIKSFPYVGSNSKEWKNGFYMVNSHDIPKQICHVLFIWKYFGDEIPMKFTGGFLGAEFNKDLRQVKPAHFWCVTKDQKGLKNYIYEMFDYVSSKFT